MKNKNWKFYLIFFLFTLIILRSFIKTGVPYTHDGNNHLARIANVYLAIRERHFPIRWAKNLNYKFGYPVFNFNYYFPFLLTIPFYLVFRSIEWAWKAVIFFSFFGGSVFSFLWLKKHFKLWPAFVGALFYLFTPYLLVNVFVRGVTGEIFCYALIPLIFWLLDLYFEKKNKWLLFFSSLAVFIFSLSHNIAAMLFFPVIILYTIFSTLKNKKNLSSFAVNVLPIILGVLMSLFFWLPALFEKKYTNLDAVDISYFFKDHFPTFRQLVSFFWGYGFSKSGIDDGMSFSIGPFHFILCIIASIVFLIKIKYGIKNKQVLQTGFFVSLFWLTVFAMLPISAFLWQIIPFLHYVQFPWRLLLITAPLASFLISFLASNIDWKIFILIVCLQFFSYTLPRAKPKSVYHNPNFYYYEFPFTTSLKDENMPIWFEKGKSDQLDKQVLGLNYPLQFNQLKWNTASHLYKINTNKDNVVVEHTAYFPGWKVFVDAKQVDIDYQNNEYPGLITYKVLAGEHEVETVFTENTVPRITGNILSISGLLVLGFLLIKGAYGEKK